MITAGYKLEFDTEEPLEDVISTCNALSENSGWKDKAGIHANNIFIKTDTMLKDDDFFEAGYEDGKTLFQQLCFGLAEQYPEIPFTGVCLFQEDEEHISIRLSMKYTGENMDFTMRKTTSQKICFHSTHWNRTQSGHFRKGEFGRYREKDRKQSNNRENRNT